MNNIFLPTGHLTGRSQWSTPAENTSSV